MAQRTKWSDDAFLDTIRAHTDARADSCVAELGESRDYHRVFGTMLANGGIAPPDTPEPLLRFFAETNRLPGVESDRVRFPEGVNRDRLQQGEAAFYEHATVSCLVLLAKALPEGYAAPCLSEILSLSGNLDHHPFRRLLGVLQMVVNMMAPGAYRPTGKAVLTAQQMRLMHAGVRRFAREHWDGGAAYEARYGPPVNFEDMLATVMGFSILVISGMQSLGVALSDDDAEAYYYVWRVAAQMMGIFPPNEPDSSAWVPGNLAEANEFYASYARRHYASAADNPLGVTLARHNLAMLEEFVPRDLQHLGFRHAPHIYMTQLIGADGCVRIGIPPVSGNFLVRGFLSALLHAWVRTWNLFDQSSMGRAVHDAVSRALLSDLIVKGVGNVSFRVPQNLKELRALAEKQ